MGTDSHFLVLGSLGSRNQRVWCLVWTHFSLDGVLTVTLCGRGEQALWELLVKALIPLPMPSQLPKCPPKSVTVRTKISKYEFWRGVEVQSRGWGDDSLGKALTEPYRKCQAG